MYSSLKFVVEIVKNGFPTRYVYFAFAGSNASLWKNWTLVCFATTWNTRKFLCGKYQRNWIICFIILVCSLQLEYYPEINLNCDAFNSTSIAGSSLSSNKCVDSWRNVMVPVNEGVMKRIIRTFFESGFAEALNEARDSQTATSSPMISSTAEFTFQTMEFLKRLKSKIFPHMKEQGIASIAKHSETR